MGCENAGSRSCRWPVNDLDEILASALRNGATSVHLFEGEAPAARVRGELRPLAFPPVSRRQTTVWLPILAGSDAWSEAERTGSGRTSPYPGPSHVLFRGRLCVAKEALGIVLSPLLPPPSIDPRLLPPSLRHLADLRGLVLLSGPIASGKTTLLAGLIAWMGSIRRWRILTFAEGPAPFAYPLAPSWISPWEIPWDFPSMAEALGSTLAQDADMVAIDPLRGAAAIEAALDLAESGKLVLATYEAEGSAAAVANWIGLLDQNDRRGDRERLATTLRLTVSLTLLQRLDREGSVVVYESIPGHPAVAAAIRSGELASLAEFVQVGPEGGKRLDDALLDLCQTGVVGVEEAFGHAREKERFLLRLDGALPDNSDSGN